MVLAELSKDEHGQAELQRSVHLFARVKANMQAAKQWSAERLPVAIAERDFTGVDEGDEVGLD